VINETHNNGRNVMIIGNIELDINPFGLPAESK
jgi:hypothetical protein